MTTNPTLPAVSSPYIVDLFAGPGGLDVGAHWVGVPSIGVEFDAGANATRGAAGLFTKPGDVRTYGPEDFPSCNVLAGGPPCQTFTVAGSGAGRRALDLVLDLVEKLGEGRFAEVDDAVAGLDDERTGLVLQPLIWALTAPKPYEAIMLEQVPTVLPVWRAVGKVLEQNGYGQTSGILHTEEYGVPQTRRRAVLIARRGVPSEQMTLPAPTHHRYRGPNDRPGSAGGLKQWETMGRALPSLGQFEVVSNYGTGGDAKARGTRAFDLPAFTVTGKVSRNKIKFADGTDRRFTMEEAGRLQTFPIDFPWSGGDISQQVGNAVPPVLAVHVLAAVLGIEPTIKAKALNGPNRPWTRNSPASAVTVKVIREKDLVPALF